MNLDDIELKLKRLGYTNIQRENGKCLSIFTDGHRVKALEDVTLQFKVHGAYYDPEKGPSSIGAVCIGDFAVRCRPLNRQGRHARGIENEHMIYDEIKFLTKNGAIAVRIKDGVTAYTYNYVVDVEHVRHDYTLRKKADLLLVIKDGTRIPISIKKDNSDMWESADTYWGRKAKRIVDDLEDQGEIEIEKTGNVYSIDQNVAIKANRTEKEAVAFGSDIKRKNGFVVVRTFRSSDFSLVSDNDVLEINCTKIIDQVSSIGNVYFLIRNDKTRTGSKIRPGIRVVAVDESRLGRTTKVVRR